MKNNGYFFILRGFAILIFGFIVLINKAYSSDLFPTPSLEGGKSCVVMKIDNTGGINPKHQSGEFKIGMVDSDGANIPGTSYVEVWQPPTYTPYNKVCINKSRFPDNAYMSIFTDSSRYYGHTEYFSKIKLNKNHNLLQLNLTGRYAVRPSISPKPRKIFVPTYVSKLQPKYPRIIVSNNLNMKVKVILRALNCCGGQWDGLLREIPPYSSAAYYENIDYNRVLWQYIVFRMEDNFGRSYEFQSRIDPFLQDPVANRVFKYTIGMGKSCPNCLPGTVWVNQISNSDDVDAVARTNLVCEKPDCNHTHKCYYRRMTTMGGDNIGTPCEYGIPPIPTWWENN